MFKRVGLFLMVNFLVLATFSLISNLLGLKPYMTANGINYASLLVFCLLWGSVGSFISLMMSKYMAKKMMGVQIVDAHGPYSGLVQKVHFMAKRSGIEKMPEVGIYDSPEVNAFATGPSKNNSLVAVSTGLLNSMNEDEVEGVLAHEVSHVANGDMITMALIQGVVNAFVMFLSRIVAQLLDNMARDEDGNGGLGMFGYMASVFVLDMIFGLMAMPIVAWFSRYREYRADAGGAKLAGKEKMIAALESLQRNVEKIEMSKSGFQNFKISNKSGWLSLISTHPSLELRIKALNSL